MKRDHCYLGDFNQKKVTAMKPILNWRPVSHVCGIRSLASDHKMKLHVFLLVE